MPESVGLPKHLQDGEVIVLACRRHFAAVASRFATFLAAFAVMILGAAVRASQLIQTALVVLFLLYLFLLAFSLLRWYFSALVVTTARVLLTGLSDNAEEIAKLDKILEIRTQPSWPGQALGFSNIVMSVAGKGQRTIECIPFADSVCNEISKFLET